MNLETIGLIYLGIGQYAYWIEGWPLAEALFWPLACLRRIWR